MADFDLQRFVEAQERVYDQALAELRNGRKESHWMWFVFPQLAGLGRSSAAKFYGIGSAEEARAYLAHSVLGARLLECTNAVFRHPDRGAEAIFGSVDAMKFRSSMTLFERVAEDPAPFARALEQFNDGARDEATLALLER
jgi:uncharacterized protein (DUF1810 family)